MYSYEQGFRLNSKLWLSVQVILSTFRHITVSEMFENETYSDIFNKPRGKGCEHHPMGIPWHNIKVYHTFMNKVSPLINNSDCQFRSFFVHLDILQSLYSLKIKFTETYSISLEARTANIIQRGHLDIILKFTVLLWTWFSP